MNQRFFMIVAGASLLSISAIAHADNYTCSTSVLSLKAGFSNVSKVIGPFLVDYEPNRFNPNAPATPSNERYQPYIKFRGPYIFENAPGTLVQMTSEDFTSIWLGVDTLGNRIENIQGMFNDSSFSIFSYVIGLDDSYAHGFISVMDGHKSYWSGTIQCQIASVLL